MVAKTLLTREEYLTTSFDPPEPDYLDGKLVPRSTPDTFHSRVQTRLMDAFKPLEDLRELFRAPEIRLLVAPDRFRIADFAAFASEQITAIPEDAPYIVIETVSPDDRYEDLMIKLNDYENAGIGFIYVVDPPLRKLSRYLNGDLLTVRSIELPKFELKIPVEQILP